jgi:SEC-C motif
MARRESMSKPGRNDPCPCGSGKKYNPSVRGDCTISTERSSTGSQRSKRRHLESWLDTPIPALSGMTPREAASKPRKRKDLILLLKEVENHESRAPREQQIDVSVLWTELGLEGAR